MNKNLIFFTSILLFLGLFGIGVVQLFWLKGAIKSREHDFDKAVYEAMGDMSRKIEDLSYKPIVTKMMQSQKIYTNEKGEIIVEMSGNSNPEEDYNSYKQQEERPKPHHHPFSYSEGSPMFSKPETDNSYPTEVDNLQELTYQQMTSLQAIAELLDTSKLNLIII